MSEPLKPSGPELSAGIELSEIPDGEMLAAQVQGAPVVAFRRGEEVFVLAGACGHYGAPLSDGIFIGYEVRCPWHHARFDVRTGEAVNPPSPRGLPTWMVVREGSRVRAGARRDPIAPKNVRNAPSSVLVVGAGGAGDSCAEQLRRRGYDGPITLVAKDAEGWPLDRPNLSKDVLAGTAPDEWLPIRGAEFYAGHRIELVDAEVTRLETGPRLAHLADGRALPFGVALLATGASPIRLPIPGADLPHVHVLRTLADMKGIIGALRPGLKAVVIGASFIGLEVAASLRARQVEVTVVAPEARPLERILGAELGGFVQALHEEKGVRFHLGRKPATITPSMVTCDDGSTIPGELVVMGVGVRPNLSVAEKSGLKVDRGVVVDANLRTSAPGVWAAGDIARFPRGDESWRIEHWVVAEQHGQVAARDMLGVGAPYGNVPFFWSQHYDVPINYTGHAEKWDAAQVAGSLKDRNALVAYRQKGRIVAVASVYRDRDSLLAEDALGRGDQPALEQLMRSVQ
ncbi:MAG TPA: FAD-dependent oxidoreductase [Myxococcaceae bacterium]|jgi:NADPH-dependent 2,4-dienoyl-CoA reductase/sulfur reductase-like enzyme/nitrite reductase/ring-hydroxylating ferredoxin subunit